MKSILQEFKGSSKFDSLVNDLIKNFLEGLVKAELTEHLNYEKYDLQCKKL